MRHTGEHNCVKKPNNAGNYCAVISCEVHQRKEGGSYSKQQSGRGQEDSFVGKYDSSVKLNISRSRCIVFYKELLKKQLPCDEF